MNNPKIIKLITRHEQVLGDYLADYTIPASRLKDAIQHSLFSGGKRLRPLLVYLCGEILAVPLACLDIIAIAVELIHCYSLIHDDLPAMDNDDYRRGKPSCHRAFDEATAILAGDALQAMAFELLLEKLPAYLALEQVITLAKDLIKSCGAVGMVSGQSLDLTELSQSAITVSQLQTIHQLKTGKLISACIDMVLVAAKPTESEILALRTFAGYFGLVFQMQDDYLDKYGHHSLSGKQRASDSANQKITYAELYSQAELAQLISVNYQYAITALEPLGKKMTDLLALTLSLQQRTYIK